MVWVLKLSAQEMADTTTESQQLRAPILWALGLARYRGVMLGICLFPRPCRTCFHPASGFQTQLLIKAAITILLQMPFCTSQQQKMVLRETKILSQYRETHATTGKTLEGRSGNVCVYGDHKSVLQYLPLGNDCLLFVTWRTVWSRAW